MIPRAGIKGARAKLASSQSSTIGRARSRRDVHEPVQPQALDDPSGDRSFPAPGEQQQQAEEQLVERLVFFGEVGVEASDGQVMLAGELAGIIVEYVAGTER